MLMPMSCWSPLTGFHRLSHNSAEVQPILRDLTAASAVIAVAEAAVVVDLPGVVGEEVALILDGVCVVCV